MTTISTETFARVALAEIVASTTNPRKSFDQAKLAELAESIRATGVHQPVLLRPLPASRLEDTTGMDPRPAYELVCGERRLRASVLAEVATIPALIRALTDAEALEIQVIENLQRDDLQPLEEAEGYQALMEHHEPPMTADEVAAKIGKSRSYVYARLKLLDLGPEGREALLQGKLDASRGLLIARIPDTKLQAEALKEAADWQGNALSYRELARIVHDRYMLRLSAARFKTTDANLVPAAGSCRACPKRTGANPDLFADVQGADVCTDPACFKLKEQAHTDAALKAARESGATIIEGREAKALMPSAWTGAVEGYLRLDDAKDSPTDKPLRSLIGKQMEKQGIQPTYVANPHRDGELVAVIDHATAQQLLAAKGLADQAEKLAAEAARSEKAAAEQAKRKAKERFEREWRWRVLERTWEKIDSLDETALALNDEAIRYLATRYANNLNQDRAKRLCQLLDLGKVAPVQAVKDWVHGLHDVGDPERALALLMLNADVEYEPWRSEADQNAALKILANAHDIDIEAVKDEVKKEHAAAARELAKKAKAAETAQAQEPSSPLPSAAQAGGVRGKGKAKVQGVGKTAAAKKPKISAEEARTGIAAAMQNHEAGADDGPGDPAGSAGGLEQRPTSAAGGSRQLLAYIHPDQSRPVLDCHGIDLAINDRVRIVDESCFTGTLAIVLGLNAANGRALVRPDGLSEEYVFDPEELEVLWPLNKGDTVQVRSGVSAGHSETYGVVQDVDPEGDVWIRIDGAKGEFAFQRGELDLIHKRRKVYGACKAATKEDTGLEWMKGDRVRVARDSGHEHAGAIGTIMRIDQEGAIWIDLDDVGSFTAGNRSLLEFVCRPDVKALPLPTREEPEATQ